MKKYLLPLLFAVSVVGGFFFPLVQKPIEIVRESVGVALPAAVAVFETSLSSPITSSASSMLLTANSVRGGTSLSGYNCFTVDEGSASAEFICGTVSGTTVSALTRGIDPATGTSTVASLQFAHRRGANVKITDFPLITILRNQANGVETFPNALKYAITIQDSDLTSATNSLVSYNLLSNSLAAGTVDGSTIVKGVFEGATALEQASSTVVGSTLANLVLLGANATDTPTYGCAAGFTGTAGAGCSVIAQLSGKIKQTWLNLTEAITFSELTAVLATFTGTTTASNGVQTLGTNIFMSVVASTTLTSNTLPQPVYVATTTGALQLSDANVDQATQFLGFARQSVLNGATSTVQIDGIVPGFTGLTRGARYFVQDAVGTIGTTVGTNEVYVGIALSSTELLIQRNYDGGWQYLGSVAFTSSFGATNGCNATATSSPLGSKFLINAVATGGGNPTWGAQGQVTLMRKGLNSITIQSQVTDSGPVTSSSGYTVSFTPSTNVFQLTGANTNNGAAQTCTGTVYMYR